MTLLPRTHTLSLPLMLTLAWGCGDAGAGFADGELLAPPETETEVAAFKNMIVDYPDGEPPAPSNAAGTNDTCVAACSGSLADACRHSLTRFDYRHREDCYSRCYSGCEEWYYGVPNAAQVITRNCPLICKSVSPADSCVNRYCEPSDASCNYIYKQFVSDPGWGEDGSACTESCRRGCNRWYGGSSPNCLWICP